MALSNDCGICLNNVKGNQKAISCEQCDKWFHFTCVGLPPLSTRAFASINVLWLGNTCVKPVKNFIDRNRVTPKKLEAKKVKEKNIVENKTSISPKISKNTPKLCKNDKVNKTPINLENKKTNNANINIFGDSLVRDIGKYIVNKRGGKTEVLCYLA